MFGKLIAVGVLLLVLCARAAIAADAYFLLFSAQGRQYASGAPVFWTGDVLFYNARTSPADVRLLGVSNGATQPNVQPLTLAPGRVTSLNADTVVGPQWVPVPTPLMWVAHVDIPPGIFIESRDELYVGTGVPEIGALPRGKVSMPIFRELTPAGSAQVHLGTDLGGNTSRINVVIYNAGSDAAVATVEVRRLCDNGLADTRTVMVPPNTVLQVTGLTIGAGNGCPEPAVKPWARYTVVTVSQPSLSVVSNVNESIQPIPADLGVIPVVGLGVARTEQF